MEDTLQKALADIASGKPVILVDDSSVEKSVVLVAAADKISAESTNFLIAEGRGHIYAPCSEARIRELNLAPMVEKRSPASLALTVSVESRTGVTTGISAADRAQTLKILATTQDGPRELISPGHIFPIIARAGGVLMRHHWVEAAVDLMILSKCAPVAVSAFCLSDSGNPLTVPEANAIAMRFGLTVLTTSDVVRERMNSEPIIAKVAETLLPVAGVGTFRAHCFRSLLDGAEHLALTAGEFTDQRSDEPVLVRVQSENPLADLLAVPQGQPFFGALKKIFSANKGVFIYVRHPRQGLLAATLADMKREIVSKTVATPPGDTIIREYGTGSQIVRSFGINRVRLLTNSAKDRSALTPFQLEIVEEVPFAV